MRSLLALVCVPGAVAAAGCATGGDATWPTLGTDVDSGAQEQEDGGGAGQDTGARGPVDSAVADSSHAEAGEQADSGQVDSGVDSGNALSCAPPDPCSAASTSLGTIAGDESGPTVTQMGDTSEWLRLDLQEKDNSVIGHAMTFTGILTSAPGTNFDLYAYLGSAIGTIQCSMPKGQSTNPAGQTDTVSFSWGETTGGLANGSDDSATVMIEVRWVSGACASGSSWSLSAHGN